VFSSRTASATACVQSAVIGVSKTLIRHGVRHGAHPQSLRLSQRERRDRAPAGAHALRGWLRGNGGCDHRQSDGGRGIVRTVESGAEMAKVT
jgi:hypothetical protein